MGFPLDGGTKHRSRADDSRHIAFAINSFHLEILKSP